MAWQKDTGLVLKFVRDENGLPIINAVYLPEGAHVDTLQDQVAILIPIFQSPEAKVAFLGTNPVRQWKLDKWSELLHLLPRQACVMAEQGEIACVNILFRVTRGPIDGDGRTADGGKEAGGTEGS